MADKNDANKARLKEITDGIEQGIKDLYESDRYMQYLRTMSRFHKYSVNNTMLIFMQKPDATLVAGFNKWRDQFERHVIKGEKGITIIAPTPLKKKIEMEKIDPDTQAPILDGAGKVVTEEKEIQIPLFKPVSVFDVSQTDGKPLPQLAANIGGDVARYELFFEALRRASPVPISIETMSARLDGYFDLERQDIAIRRGMSEIQTISAIIHEVAHAKLHNNEQDKIAAAADKGNDPPAPKNRNTEEVEAESISYAVCQYYGIDTGKNSFGYIATWSKTKELPELRASLEVINKTASGLITDTDYHFNVVLKEYDSVIERFASDYEEYIRTNVENTLLLPVREEIITETISDIKNGHSNYARSNLLDADLANEGSAFDLLTRLDEIEKIYPPLEQEALYLLDGETYLHLRTAIDGYDYTLYDRETMREIDGGMLDTLELSFEDAYKEILAIHELEPEASENVPLDILDEIQTVPLPDIKNDVAAVRNNDTTPKPPPLEQTVVNIAMPDNSISIENMNLYGYYYDGILPLQEERALELYDRDMCIYLLYEDNTEAMVNDRDEIENHSGIFGIEREDWQASLEYEVLKDAVKNSEASLEADFLYGQQDSYAIYQLKGGDETRNYRFEPFDRLTARGFTVDRDNYALVYSAPHGGGDTLNNIYNKFNENRPLDFTGHSLSVSDIIAIKQNGVVSCHYVDSFGFVELPGFNSGKNPLRSVEDSIEQNDNQLDGIINNTPIPTVAELEAQVKAGQTISLLDLAEAVKADKPGARESVIKKLQQPMPPQERKKAAPAKGAEREL